MMHGADAQPTWLCIHSGVVFVAITETRVLMLL